MLRAIILVICSGSAALAQSNDVPRLSDGTVDVAAVMSSFKVESELASDGQSGSLTGIILGKQFGVSVSQGGPTTTSTLTIHAPTLSEEATYLVAVLLHDLICLKQNRRPGLVQWPDTAVEIADGWRVNLSCLTEPESS